MAEKTQAPPNAGRTSETAPGKATGKATTPTAKPKKKKKKKKGGQGAKKTSYKPTESSAHSAPRKERVSKTSAILVKPKEGVSYADALRTLKSQVTPEQSGVDVRSYRPTKDGEIVLKLKKGKGDEDVFKKAIAGAIGEGLVRNLTAPKKLGILNLDAITTADDVRKDIYGVDCRDVYVFPPNKWQKCLAVVNVEDNEAQKILKKNRLKT